MWKKAKPWLRQFAGEVSSLDQVLDGRVKFRKIKESLKSKLGSKILSRKFEDLTTHGKIRHTLKAHKPNLVAKVKEKASEEMDEVHIGMSFNYGGMKKLTYSARDFESNAFKNGLLQSSSLLGDPTDPKNPGSPNNWVVGNEGNIPEVLIIIAADVVATGEKKAKEIAESAKKNGLELIYQEDGHVLPGSLRGHEQFGFHDNVSQPGIRGVVEQEKGLEYVTKRAISNDVLPDAKLYGLPGQDLIWPGEFVFGYPAQTQDPMIPGNIRQEGPEWTKNGSFMVFRRLRQDVKLFWDEMERQAEELKKKAGFKGTNQVNLAARMVGRWPSGAPYSRVPDKDVPELGENEYFNNNFKYGTNTCPVSLKNGMVDHFPRCQG